MNKNLHDSIPARCLAGFVVAMALTMMVYENEGTADREKYFADKHVYHAAYNAWLSLYGAQYGSNPGTFVSQWDDNLSGVHILSRIVIFMSMCNTSRTMKKEMTTITM